MTIPIPDMKDDVAVKAWIADFEWQTREYLQPLALRRLVREVARKVAMTSLEYAGAPIRECHVIDALDAILGPAPKGE